MPPTPPAISVIVAIYNAEKFLPHCLESILAQRFRDFELILINDGSHDASARICNDFAARDSRIRIFHQENQGVAKTRQRGTELARGKYSIHVDADDHIEPDMLGDLYATACRENADMVICDYYIGPNEHRLQNGAESPYDRHSLLTDLLSVRQTAALWNKLIRHSLYETHQIQFFPDTPVGEDFLVLVQLLRHDLRIAYRPQAYYHYTPNPASLTRRHDLSRYEAIRTIATRHLPRLLPDETYRPYIRAYRIVHLADACRSSGISAGELKRLVPLRRSAILLARQAPLSDRLTLCTGLAPLPLFFRKFLLKTGTLLHRFYRFLFFRRRK